MRSTVLLTLSGLAAIAIAAGCSSEPDPNDPSQYQAAGQYPPGSYPPGSYPPGSYPPGPGGQYPTATAPGTTTAPPTATGTEGSTGSATPIPPVAAAMATQALTALASKETAGMQPDGPAFAGNFQQGQTLEQAFTIEAGKCYTVVGVGVGITELDIQLVVQAGPVSQPLAQDSTTGPTAVAGGGSNCVKNPFPVAGSGKVILRATGGTGIAVAQIYKK